MPEKPTEFWNLDLKRLTVTGWLLMLLTLGTVLGGAVGMMFLLEALGVRKEAGDNRQNRWLAIVALAPAIGVGCGVFALGRRFFDLIGLPILRRPKRVRDGRT